MGYRWWKTALWKRVQHLSGKIRFLKFHLCKAHLKLELCRMQNMQWNCGITLPMYYIDLTLGSLHVAKV